MKKASKHLPITGVHSAIPSSTTALHEKVVMWVIDSLAAVDTPTVTSPGTYKLHVQL